MFILFWLITLPASAQVAPDSYSLQTLAGAGRGDLGPALEAVLDGPSGLAEDSSGNLYISESNAGVIRVVLTDGTIERFAGSGIIGDGFAGSQALATDLSAPAHLLVDRDGGLIFADTKTCRIRKVANDGTVRDLVGTGSCTAAGGFGRPPIGGSSGRPQLGTEMLLNSIGAIVLDPAGLLVFSDPTAGVVRRLDADGYVRTIAGTGGAGYSGDSGDATSATLNLPAGLAYDTAGNLYIGDGSNCRVRAVDPAGIITTVAGNGTCMAAGIGFATGLANRSIGRVGSLAYDPGTNFLYVATPSTYRVIRVDLAQTRMEAFVGSGRVGIAFSTPLATDLNSIAGIQVRSDGSLLLSSDNSYQVYVIQDGSIRAFAGRWPQVASYPPPLAASLVKPSGLALRPDGSLLLADAGAQRIVQVQSPDEMIPIAGARYPAGYSLGDGGKATDAVLATPQRILVAPDGQIYFTEANRIRVIDNTGSIRTLLSSLAQPAGLAWDPGGNLVYSEAGAHKVTLYNPVTRVRTVIAGTGTAGFSGDSGAATNAQINTPADVRYDSKGNLWVVDRGNRRIRRVGVDGVIRTLIGSARGFSYDDITGQAANDIGLGDIGGIAIDGDDNVYVAESTRLSVTNNDGRAFVLAGFLSQADDGTNRYLKAPINGISAITVDSAGRVYYSLPQEGKVMSLRK